MFQPTQLYFTILVLLYGVPILDVYMYAIYFWSVFRGFSNVLRVDFSYLKMSLLSLSIRQWRSVYLNQSVYLSNKKNHFVMKLGTNTRESNLKELL
jgi:hypothetical protein